jgi:hypothetical protein
VRESLSQCKPAALKRCRRNAIGISAAVDFAGASLWRIQNTVPPSPTKRVISISLLRKAPGPWHIQYERSMTIWCLALIHWLCPYQPPVSNHASRFRWPSRSLEMRPPKCGEHFGGVVIFSGFYRRAIQNTVPPSPAKYLIPRSSSRSPRAVVWHMGYEQSMTMRRICRNDRLSVYQFFISSLIWCSRNLFPPYSVSLMR